MTAFKSEMLTEFRKLLRYSTQSRQPPSSPLLAMADTYPYRCQQHQQPPPSSPALPTPQQHPYQGYCQPPSPPPNPHPPQPQTPSMIINSHPLPHQFPGVSQTHSPPHPQCIASHPQQYHPPTSPTNYQSAQPLVPNPQSLSHHAQYFASVPQQPPFQHPPSIIIGQTTVPLSPLPPFPTVHTVVESPSPAHMRYNHHSLSTGDYSQNMKHDQQHFCLNHDCDGVGSKFGTESSGIDTNFANGKGESGGKKVGIDSRKRTELRQQENISVEKDGHGPSLFVKRREYHGPHLHIARPDPKHTR